MEGRFRIKREVIFTLLVLWIWTSTILLQYVRAVILRFPIIGAYPDILLSCIFFIIVLAALPYCRIARGDLLLLFTIVTVFLFQWMLNKEAQEYLNQYMVSFVIQILPLYIVGVSLGGSENKEQIIRQMYLLSMVTLAASVLYRFAFGAPMSDAVSKYRGDMDHAYKVLPHCCLIAYFAVKRRNIWNVAFAILGGFYLLMLGTRGAALIYLVLIALLLIIGKTSKGAIARTIVVFGALGAFIASPLYNAALLWMYQIARQLGLSIRVFDKLLSGAEAASSGRDLIAETLLDAVAKKPLLGYGICGDRVLIGGYAHNIAIELWIDFGIIIGTAILAAFVIVMFLGYVRAKGEGEKGLILTLFFSAFCMLFLSGSYLDNRLLFFLLGLCACSIRKSKYDRMRQV